MFDEADSGKEPVSHITLGADLSTLSLGDIDDLVAALEAEIGRLKEERNKKSGSLSEAEKFFKISK